MLRSHITVAELVRGGYRLIENDSRALGVGQVGHRLDPTRYPVSQLLLDRLLKNLSGDQTVSVIRAFTYFSHLANLAEDRHHIRRRQVHVHRGASSAGRPSSTSAALTVPMHARTKGSTQ